MVVHIGLEWKGVWGAVGTPQAASVLGEDTYKLIVSSSTTHTPRLYPKVGVKLLLSLRKVGGKLAREGDLISLDS